MKPSYAKAEAFCETKARHPPVKPGPIDARRAQKANWSDPTMRANTGRCLRCGRTVARRHQGFRPPPIPRCWHHGGTGRGRPSHVRLRTPADFLPASDFRKDTLQIASTLAAFNAKKRRKVCIPSRPNTYVIKLRGAVLRLGPNVKFC